MLLEPEPAAAGAVFGDSLASARRYARLLAGPGVERGMLGPREPARLWSRHLLNCAALAHHVHRGVTVADIGSGAGLPGIVLALMRPDLWVTLVEPLLRRSAFLTEAVAELAVPNVTVVRARAEDLAGRVQVDTAVARAVAPLPRLAAWSLPLLIPGGTLLALKGQAATAELAAAEPELRRLGAVSWHVVPTQVAPDGSIAGTFVVQVTKGHQPTPPRRRPPVRSRRQAR